MSSKGTASETYTFTGEPRLLKATAVITRPSLARLVGSMAKVELA